MTADDSTLMTLFRAIVADDTSASLRLLSTSPDLAVAQLQSGATRQESTSNFFEEIQHYVYAGDTALHVASAAHRVATVKKLITMGADVHAKNRRGAEPLHYAADGIPGSNLWDPAAQAATIAILIQARANPNAVDKDGVTPLHRAVRNRCAAAVRTLLEAGADPSRKNKRGSTSMALATQNTGRSGSGSPEAKEQQIEILQTLKAHALRA